MTAQQRTTLGVLAVLFLAVGGFGAARRLDPAWPGVMLRAGMLLGAIWFAAPAFGRVSQRVLIGVGIVAAVLVIRPTLILWGLAAGLAGIILAGRANA